jgi:predicted amidohydrolase
MRVTIACVFDRKGLGIFDTSPPDAAIDLLILPELFDGGYELQECGGNNPAQTAALIDRFRAMSERHHLHLVAGTLAIPDAEGDLQNASIVLSCGKEIGRFPKVHMFPPLDGPFFVRGDQGETVTLSCGNGSIRLGVIICYDLRFPEIVRPWFKAGLDLLIVPARWPRVRDHLWQVLLRARAIENQCFVVGINSRDDEGGGSYAFGPDGDPVFAMKPDPEPGEPPWRTFTIDTGDIERVKDRVDTRADAVLL